MKKHPLVQWLSDNATTIYAIAPLTGVSRRVLYSHIEGKVRNPTAKVMFAIEKITKRAVTVQSQADWFRGLK